MNEFKHEYKQISTKHICSDASYQRELNTSRVQKIVNKFNPNLVNEIKVSFRDGKYWVFNGQHTMKALEKRNGGEPLLVDCKVFYGMTREDEARLFAEQNGIEKVPSSAQKLRALYAAGDIDVNDFVECVTSAGIKCDFTSSKGDRKIVCYSSAFKIFKKYGSGRLYKILSIITAAWDGQKESYCKEIIEGLSIFLDCYGAKIIDSELIKNLGKVSPLSIVRDGKLQTTGASKRFAWQILNIYNKKRTTNRLDNLIM